MSDKTMLQVLKDLGPSALEQIVSQLGANVSLKTKFKDVGIRREGTHIILPEKMTYAEGRLWLQRQEDAEEKVVAIHATIPCFPLDGIIALRRAMEDRYGFAALADTPGFWGPEPPTMVQVKTSDGLLETAPIGRLQPPMYEGGYLNAHCGEMVVTISGEVKKKFEDEVRRLILRAEELLAAKSIYRGTAFILNLDWITNEDDFHPVNHAPVFMDVSEVDESALILNRETLMALKINIFTLLENTEACRKNGIPLKHGCILVGEYGCLAGDTMIAVNRAGKGFSIQIEDLVERFNGGGPRKWDPDIPTMVQREMPDGTIRLGKMLKGWSSGLKKTYRVTTETGRTIIATEEHPFLTEHGWLQLGKLKIGDLVHVRGPQASGLGNQRERGERVKYKSKSVGPYHPYGKGTKSGGYHVLEHRLAFEADMNHMTMEDYISRLILGQTCGLVFLEPGTIIHHKDGNTFNNDPSNLEEMAQPTHALLHSDETVRNVLFKVELEAITDIAEHGTMETYDIEVDGEPHNFIANGFVVHNTGKTMTARVSASKAVRNGWTFIYLKSPRRIDRALKMAEMYAPAVVFTEDIDEVVGEDRNDEVNQILNTLDGVDTKDKPIITVLTTNHVENINPAFLRPGRMDTIVHFHAPDAEAAIRFVSVYGRDDDGRSLVTPMSDDEMKEVGAALAGYVPAFISEAMQKAKRLAIDRHGSDIVGKVSGDDIIAAAAVLRTHRQMMERKTELTPAEQVMDAVRLTNSVKPERPF